MIIFLVDCVWWDWDDYLYPRKPREWSECTRNCRKGRKVQTRKIQREEQLGGKPCNETVDGQKEFPCNDNLCPEEIVNNTCTEYGVRGTHHIAF